MISKLHGKEVEYYKKLQRFIEYADTGWHILENTYPKVVKYIKDEETFRTIFTEFEPEYLHEISKYIQRWIKDGATKKDDVETKKDDVETLGLNKDDCTDLLVFLQKQIP
jgi:chloramphenicol O-acetyltransferase